MKREFYMGDLHVQRGRRDELLHGAGLAARVGHTLPLAQQLELFRFTCVAEDHLYT